MDEEKIAIKLYHDKGFRPSEISRTAQAIKKIREKTRKNQSARKMAETSGLSQTTTRRILRKDLGQYPYKKSRGQGLTNSQIQKRLTRCRELKKWQAKVDLDKVVFSDEKLFGVEKKLNSQNVRICAMSDCLAVSKVMVWCGVSKKGKFPLVFIDSGIRINARYYTNNVLKPVVKEKGLRMYPDGDWTFQQDSAPAHKAKITQMWCDTNLPGFIATSNWPPSSPDLYPLNPKNDCDYVVKFQIK